MFAALFIFGDFIKKWLEQYTEEKESTLRKTALKVLNVFV